MKIVFASLPAYGHLYPMLPLALACAEFGHDVVVATGDPFLDALPVRTERGVAEGTVLHDVEQETRRNHPDAHGPEFVAWMFGETTIRLVVPDLRKVFERERPDLVVHEVLDIGAAVVAAEFGVRAVAFGLGQWLPPTTRFYEIAGADPTLSGGYLDPMPTALQDPGAVPSSRRSIRPVPWAPSMPSWEPPRERTVYVTLGTVAYGAVEVLRRAVLETAAHDVDVLVAVGPEGDPSLLGELPPNVRLERFVPQAAVFAHVDLVVHHGGAGTVLGTLAAGLPQLILPQGADQPFNAAMIKRAGAGLALANDEQTPGAIGAAVTRLLADGPERATARALARDIAAMPSPAEVASTL
ncbi:glycosyltransferase [Actinophytocola sp. NPDC049390]|uniref:glycosyltransferase n=1 Tax=Actinophytocola sp. NPDC049390 TaxID=3363894 RepID=UPI0037A4FD7C